MTAPAKGVLDAPDSVMKALEQLSIPVPNGPSSISLKYSDCGKGSHAPIVDFSPLMIPLGQKTMMIGHGKLDEQVASANFDLQMTSPVLGTMLHCSGDASQSKECLLPMGFGSLTMQAMSFPLTPGTVPVNVDMNLKSTIPATLLKTTTTAKATDQKGEELFCIEIESTPASADVIV